MLCHSLPCSFGFVFGMSRHGELGCFCRTVGVIFVKVSRTRCVLTLSKFIIDHSPKVDRFCSERWSHHSMASDSHEHLCSSEMLVLQNYMVLNNSTLAC